MVAKTFGQAGIAEQSNTIGTATYQLDGAIVGYRPFSSDFILNDTPYYAVKNPSETKYEYNKGPTAIYTPGGTPTLARATWLSSNSNNPVSWGAGDLPLIVYQPTSGELMEAMVTGWLTAARNALLSYGWWNKLNGVSSGVHQLTFYDGNTDIVVAAVDTGTHAYRQKKSTVENRVRTQVSTMRQIANVAIPADNTIPQNTEGAAMTDYDVTIVIKSATSKIRLKAFIQWSCDGAAAYMFLAAFMDSVANSVAFGWAMSTAAQWTVQSQIDQEITNPGVGSHTFKLRGATSQAGGNFTINGSAGTAYFGGTLNSYFEVTEEFI